MTTAPFTQSGKAFLKAIQAQRSFQAWKWPHREQIGTGCGKRPGRGETDDNQAAHRILEAVTGEKKPAREKKPAAVALGRLGGLTGGRARANKLSPARRKSIAKGAAEARWSQSSVADFLSFLDAGSGIVLQDISHCFSSFHGLWDGEGPRSRRATHRRGAPGFARGFTNDAVATTQAGWPSPRRKTRGSWNPL